METKIKGIIPDKVDVIIDSDDIINYINSLPMKHRWPVFIKIMDNIKISDLTDQQRQQIKTYLQTEQKKLEASDTPTLSS